ncbi:MAG: hypothetical protein U0P30_00510 [Vicinamibacterales bacterium]
MAALPLSRLAIAGLMRRACSITRRHRGAPSPRWTNAGPRFRIAAEHPQRVAKSETRRGLAAAIARVAAQPHRGVEAGDGLIVTAADVVESGESMPGIGFERAKPALRRRGGEAFGPRSHVGPAARIEAHGEAQPLGPQRDRRRLWPMSRGHAGRETVRKAVVGRGER